MRAGTASAAFLVAASAALLVAAFASAGQDIGPIEHYSRGVGALEAKKPEQARTELELASAGLPGQPEVLYALARANALSGDPAAAVKLLGRVVAMGYGAGADADPAFASLASLPDFLALAAKIQENGKPVALAAPAFTVAEADLIPEGIAWDPRTRSLFVGSLAKRKIIAIAPDGRVRDFVPADRGLLQVLGMKVDGARRSLWACTAEGDPPEGENTSRRAVLLRIDLATGRILQRIPSPPGGRHLFNDLAIARGGDLYLTDSEEGSVYRLRAASETLERLAPPDTLGSLGSLIYPNGIALSDDDRFLYVAHEGGITAWELAKRRSFPLSAPDDVALAGIDGLSFYRGALIGVQNGMRPHRVILLTLAPSLDRVTSARVLERGNPLFEIPTTGAVAGDSYYFMANTQLRALGPGGVIKEPEKRKPVVILKLTLPRSGG